MERRYTDSELAEILAGASNRQAGGGQDGWSVEQVYAMAAELGIDPDNVRRELARHSTVEEPAVGTTETIPNMTIAVGGPKGLTLRRRMRGELPTVAIEDIAEDARRSFGKIRRLESRNDELLVVGTIEGADAELTVEAGPKFSVMSMSLRFLRIGRWIHGLVQFLVALIVLFGFGPNGGSFIDLLIPWLAYGGIGFGVATALTFLVARSARVKAERAFELQANRAARMLNASLPDSAQIDSSASIEPDSDLNKRLRHEH